MSKKMRRKLVVGNWKMHGSLAQNEALMTSITAGLRDLKHADFAVCVPAPYLFQAQSLLQGSNIAWGGQNISQHEYGAYTGGISARMLADFGCTYALIGHSERRVLIHETNTSAAASFGMALRAGLTPIFCVGETLEERQAGVSEAVVASQMIAILNTLGLDVISKAVQLRAVIAYEPSWAIGTGRTATPEQAQSMHTFIRSQIAERDPGVANRVRILYGGSVNPSNASQLLAMPDIDGGLIGRCSLSPEEFIEICRSASEIGGRAAAEAGD
jgi:triosephosphate isomerase